MKVLKSTKQPHIHLEVVIDASSLRHQWMKSHQGRATGVGFLPTCRVAFNSWQAQQMPCLASRPCLQQSRPFSPLQLKRSDASVMSSQAADPCSWEMLKSVVQQPTPQKWPLYSGTTVGQSLGCTSVKERTGQTQACLQPAREPACHGPCAPAPQHAPKPHFRLLPSYHHSQLLKSAKWHLLCPQNIC